MDILGNLDLLIAGAASMLVGISVGGLIMYGFLQRKQQRRPIESTSKTPRISGLDLFELPDSLRNQK